MKHLQLWESKSLSYDDVALLCKYYGIKKWTLNPDGTIDVIGDCELYQEQFAELPLRFGRVVGFFGCQVNYLTNLKGAPHVVKGSFNCSDNWLTSLEGGPIMTQKTKRLYLDPSKTEGYYLCDGNRLTTLQGGPKRVNGNFSCTQNQLTDLEGAPQWVGGSFNCSANKLTTLRGAPRRVGGDFYCGNNRLTSFEGISRVIGGEIYYNQDGIRTLEGLPPIIRGESSDKWLISQVNGRAIKIGILHTVPDECITPNLLNFVKKVSKKQYELIKSRREQEHQWKTDLSVDLGDLGF